ncbi:MAG: hypothetical protein HUU54_06585 [Ignavibacteriaceae bacterium]|nr:hypothetical protein [Ignavibacteriaceae bacterium]
MTAIRKILSVKGSYLKIEIPEDLKGKDIEVIILPLNEENTKKTARKKYDFSDIAGKLKWRGDAVAVQRSMRDEW